MPTTLEWYMRKLFGFERSVMKLARPVAKMLTDVPLPDESYFAAIQRLFTRLEGIDQILVDPHITTVRLVTNAEKMVLRETQRAYMYFSLYGMTTDMVIINRLFPAAEGYFSQWAATQAAYVTAIQEYFQPVPVATLPLFADEVVGKSRLQEVARTLYADDDPAQFYLEAPAYTLTKHGEAPENDRGQDGQRVFSDPVCRRGRLMSATHPPQHPWKQCAEEMAACSLTLLRTFMPDREALRILQTACWRAQAEILKGLLSVVESRLASRESGPPPTGEKIPVD
jgi:hypothetical protein